MIMKMYSDSLEEALPPRKSHPRIAIVGSVDFYHKDTPELCRQIGRGLARRFPNICLLTGANAIVHEYLSRAFYEQVVQTDNKEAFVFHLAPLGYTCPFDFGHCIVAGKDFEERRLNLVTKADICISLEGGPGTADEMNKALEAGKILLPVARTGGASSGMFGAPSCKKNHPSYIRESDWKLLSDETASIADTSQALLSIIEMILSFQSRKKKSSPHFEKLVTGFLNAKYSKRPCTESFSDYVAPALAGYAHLVVEEETVGKIFLGPKSAAGPDAWKCLSEANIVGIVNCTTHVPSHHKSKGIKYCVLPIYDTPGADIRSYLMGATTFIHSLVVASGSVLVHCEVGVSRSATVVIAYLMRFHGMTRDEAYIAVKKKRPKINPNQGFWEQLATFERTLKKQQQHPSSSDSSSADDDPSFHLDWAKESSIIFTTCRDLDDKLLRDFKVFQMLKNVKTLEDCQQVLSVCLDFLWGRGVLVHDIEWLVYVCKILSETHGSAQIISAIDFCLTNDDSSFVNSWAGEIYQDQMRRVMVQIDDAFR